MNYDKGGEINDYVGLSFCVFNSGYAFDFSLNTNSMNYTFRPKYQTKYSLFSTDRALKLTNW